MGFEIIGILTISDVMTDRHIPAHMIASAIECGLMRPRFRTENHILNIALEDVVAFLGGGVNTPTVNGSTVGPREFQDLRIFEQKITAEAAPVAPLDTDTALEGTALWVADTTGPPTTAADQLLVVEYPVLGHILFSTTIPPTSLVGTTFTEEGLFTKRGDLFARSTFTGADKRLHDGSVGSRFDHLITVTRVP